MRYKLVGLFLLLTFGLLAYGFVSAEKPVQSVVAISPTPTPVQLSSDKLFQIVNDWRLKNGYQPLKMSKTLCSIAQSRVPEIQKDYAHDGFYKYAKNLPPGSYISENLSTGYADENSTLIAWLSSESHHKALETAYTHSCIATEGSYAVQIFGYY